MQLREYLTEYRKDELLEMARDLEIKKCSGLRKAMLIDQIIDAFCAENVLRMRLSCLTKEQMTLFRKACVAPQEVATGEIIDSMQLCRYLCGFFEVDDRFCVFKEVAAGFKKIDDESFRADQKKKAWLMKCMNFFIEYYGIAPAEIIYQLYRLKEKDSIDDMISMLLDMPVDIVETGFFPLEMFGMEDWPREDPLYTEKGLFVHIPILENEEFEDLSDQQMDKDFYIPSVSQIEELCQEGYETSSLAYKKLEKFLTGKLSLPRDHATTWCLAVWANSYSGDSPTDIIDQMTESGVTFQSEAQMQEFVSLLMDAHNHTRMKENRGHKPVELVADAFRGGMPTIVPGSSHAATMMEDATPYLDRMGIPYDLDGNADMITAAMYPNGLGGKAVHVEKKVYPNDPCPCGSGKKYKKCCGKNKKS